MALTKLFVRDSNSPQAHRSAMCKRANRHISERIRYWRVDIRAGTMRSPIERDGPLPRPLRAGRGALHAHARGRATDRGRPPTKPRAKRVRHGRLRQPTAAGTRRPSKRLAAFSAALGRAEPPRRRSRASRHHCAAGHQTAHENHTKDASAVSCWARIMAHAGGIMATRGARCEIGGDRRAGVRRTAQEMCPARAW